MSTSSLLNILIASTLRGGVYALMAVGLSLVFGVANTSNFAHGEFYMIGIYFAYFAYVTFGLSPYLAILAGAVSGFVLGVVVERCLYNPLRKLSKDDWILNAFLLSSGVSIILRNGVQVVWGPRFRGVDAYWKGTIHLFPGAVGISFDRVASFLISLLAIAGLWFFLKKTRTGRAIRAVSQDERGAQLVGVNLQMIHTLTFALGTMLAGLAGASLASMTPAFPTAGIEPGVKAWYIVILAGLGNVGGAIPASLIMGLIDTVGYYFLGVGWQQVLSVFLLVLMLVFKPSGLFARETRA